MEKLGIIGCGTMGHSIALSAAWWGVPVTMYGLNINETQKAQSEVARKLETLFENGLIEMDTINLVKENILITHSIQELAAVSTFIIECIPEDMELKKELFKELDQLCEPSTILATNTSGLSPTELASVTKNPQRVVATHFWNPAHLIPLVEVARGEKTDDQTIDRAFNLLQLMKKKPIEVKKEVPGFVGNRLQFALLREAQHILEQGIASKEDIDAAVTYGIGRRLSVTGPLLSADMGGLDVFSAISDYLFNDLSVANKSSDMLKQMIDDKKFGAKTGEGYYEWDDLFLKEMNQKREKELMRLLARDAES